MPVRRRHGCIGCYPAHGSGQHLGEAQDGPLHLGYQMRSDRHAGLHPWKIAQGLNAVSQALLGVEEQALAGLDGFAVPWCSRYTACRLELLRHS